MAEQKVQQITVEEMFGIAKKFALQLKAFSMETESAIVEMVRISMQHRNLQMQREAQQAEMEQRAQALKIQEQQMHFARVQQERASAGIVSTGLHRPANGDSSGAELPAPAES